jgi:hypothetical protein
MALTYSMWYAYQGVLARIGPEGLVRIDALLAPTG